MEDEDTMHPQDGLNLKQEKAIEELQLRMKNTVTPAIRDDPTLYYRFLKARDFDIDKAEKMLQKHILWRKINQIDTLLEDFKPREFFKYTEPRVVGFDKEGNLVRFSPVGKINPFEVMKSTKMDNFMKHWFWFAEYSVDLIKRENEKTGKNAYQVVMIFDLDKLSFSDATSKVAQEMLYHFINEYQDNFPERMKSSYVLNAPAFFVIVFSLLKSLMSVAMLKKFHVFGRTGWKEKLLQIIDPDVLPAFLGGNRTDPDGNPMCTTVIHHGGKIPEYLFLTEEERYFEDKSKVQTLMIPPGEKKEIHKNVKELGSLIQWEFLVESKDVGFGLFLEESENEVKEIIPIKKYQTPHGTNRDTHKCRETGKFIFIFDNSYSWRATKEVQYCIKIVSPEL